MNPAHVPTLVTANHKFVISSYTQPQINSSVFKINYIPVWSKINQKVSWNRLLECYELGAPVRKIQSWWAIMAERPLQVQNVNNWRSYTTALWGLCDAHCIILYYCPGVWLFAPGIWFLPPLALPQPLPAPWTHCLHSSAAFISPLFHTSVNVPVPFWPLAADATSFPCPVVNTGDLPSAEGRADLVEEHEKAGLELLPQFLDIVLCPNTQTLPFSLNASLPNACKG